jgi:hypothetical protein
MRAIQHFRLELLQHIVALAFQRNPDQCARDLARFRASA